ncbi:FtsX-like permease family protein [Faecalibacter macacae]|uniref:ABC transporter permease n=1 Tax=Faecalibacter macacae TaxID=1859289 RepID=A0A3L9MI64_9FLAO|nr:FtsX-like permease family protein [Faecalibacter macacae]RLZ12385.1 ABC transporter permease [Faecalibacter macacae]
MSLSSNQLLQKIVRKEISFTRMITFFIFTIIGFYILILANVLYFDFAKNFTKDSSIWKSNYIVLNKKISTLGTLTGSKPTFDSDEIEYLKTQTFVEEIGTFKSSLFPVKLQVGGVAGIRGFSTDLFFESVPEQFIDVDNEQWKWNEGDEFIPIIIPKSYLNLYNFGFASSQGLPQVSESLFTKIPFQLVIGKGENQKVYQARIVDFTTKINTILVPENYLDWANKNFAPNQLSEPSRVIVQTSNDGEENYSAFFEEQNYDINKDELKNNELTSYLKLAFSLVLLIGGIIVFAAIWLMIINFQLLIEKNKHKIKDLSLIGFSKNQLSKPYLKMMTFFIFLGFIFSLPLVYYTVNYIKSKIGNFIVIENSSFIEVIIGSIVVLLIIIIVNSTILNRTINRIISQ